MLLHFTFAPLPNDGVSGLTGHLCITLNRPCRNGRGDVPSWLEKALSPAISGASSGAVGHKKFQWAAWEIIASCQCVPWTPGAKLILGSGAPACTKKGPSCLPERRERRSRP